MIKKLKYIFLAILSSFVFTLITLLIGKNYINILGLTIDNTLGSYPLQLDIDHYDTYQLVNAGEMDVDIFNFNAVKSFSFTDYGISLITSDNYAVGSVGTYFNPTKFENVEIGKTYTLSFDITYNNYFGYFKVGNERNLTFSYCYSNSRCNYTFVAEDIYNYVIYGYDANSSNVNNTFTIDNFMIYQGEYDANKTFVTPFKFGYNVDLAINYTPSGFHNFNAIIKLNDNICFNKTISTLNDTTYFRIKNACFIPFDLNSSGYFSLKDTSLSVELSAGSGVSSIDYQSGFILTPTLKGYYKGEYVEDIIYLKNNYLSNAFFYNGFNARVENNPITEELAKPSLFITENNKSLALYRLNDTNQTFNLIGEQIEDVSFVNSINLKNDINFTIGFDFGENTSFSSINKLKYVFSFSGINSIALGNVGSTSPLPDNNSTSNKYNRCSAWYDIPCQLGNGLTYLIYEAPIVSPVLTFVVSFITMFSSLVSFVELFKSFGIVFGCFVIYMFIELLHKYSK